MEFKCDSCVSNAQTKCSINIVGFPNKPECGVYTPKKALPVIVAPPEPRLTEGRVLSAGDSPRCLKYFKLP